MRTTHQLTLSGGSASYDGGGILPPIIGPPMVPLWWGGLPMELWNSRHSPPPVNACENITFQQLCLRAVIRFLGYSRFILSHIACVMARLTKNQTIYFVWRSLFFSGDGVCWFLVNFGCFSPSRFSRFHCNAVGTAIKVCSFLVNFGCFSPSKFPRFHCNALGNATKAHKNWNTIQENEHTPE